MSFDPTGYTLAHEHLHIDLSGFKNNEIGRAHV